MLNVEELEPRDVPSAPRTVIAVEVTVWRPELEEIRTNVEGYFHNLAPRGKLSVILTDPMTSVDLLRKGRHRDHLQTFVVELKGQSHLWLGDADAIPSPGKNHEGRSRVYLGSLHPEQLAFEAALVAAHEVGHLLGLQHVMDDDSRSIMTYGTISPRQRFLNKWLWREDGSLQNDVVVVYQSLRGN